MIRWDINNLIRNTFLVFCFFAMLPTLRSRSAACPNRGLVSNGEY